MSNLAQGLLTLGTMTGPLLTVLHLVPHGVLAGLFFIMGIQALEANGITAKLVFLARDASLTAPNHPLRRLARRKIWLFVGIELLGFGATFAITQTIAAVGFPVFIMALIPVRAWLLPRWFTPRELAGLDESTASPFIMENVGGVLPDLHDEDDEDDDTDATGVPRAAEGGEPVVRQRSRRLSRRMSERELGDGIFASPGSPRKSEEDIADRGLYASTATRRNSRTGSRSLERMRSGGSTRE